MAIQVVTEGGLRKHGSRHVSEWRYAENLPRVAISIPFPVASVLNLANEVITPWPHDVIIIGAVEYRGRVVCEYAFVLSDESAGDAEEYTAASRACGHEPRAGRRFQRQWLDPDQFEIVIK